MNINICTQLLLVLASISYKYSTVPMNVQLKVVKSVLNYVVKIEVFLTLLSTFIFHDYWSVSMSKSQIVSLYFLYTFRWIQQTTVHPLPISTERNPSLLLRRFVTINKSFNWGGLVCRCRLSFVDRIPTREIRRCIQTFPDWPPGARTARVQLYATRCSCFATLWVSLMSFAAITLYVASQRVVIVVSVYFVIDSVQKLSDTPSYIVISCNNATIM
jgi:hypothetical protein